MTAHASLSEGLGETREGHGRTAPRLALRYLGFAACALAGVPFARGWLWLPAWLALSNLALAYAYLGNHVGLLGKRHDGSLAWRAVLLLLPYLALVWGFHWLKLAALRRGEPCFHPAAPGLYLGRRPRAFELPSGCALVVDLTSEFIESSAVVAACRYRCLPVLNRHVPGERALAALLDELADEPGAIYVHCGAGRGRSAMLVAALMVLRGHAPDVDAAEHALRALRPGVRLHPAQRALIARLCPAPARRAAAPQDHSPCVHTRCA